MYTCLENWGHPLGAGGVQTCHPRCLRLRHVVIAVVVGCRTGKALRRSGFPVDGWVGGCSSQETGGCDEQSQVANKYPRVTAVIVAMSTPLRGGVFKIDLVF